MAIDLAGSSGRQPEVAQRTIDGARSPALLFVYRRHLEPVAPQRSRRGVPREGRGGAGVVL